MLRYRTPIRHAVAIARRLGAGRDTLCRRSDRIEAAATLAGAAMVLAAMAVGILTGGHVAADQTRQAHHQQATRHSVTAVLLEPAEASVSSTVPVKARWHTAHATRTGTIPVPAGLPAGHRVSIWINQTGTPTTQPLSNSGARFTGVMAGLAVPVGTALAALLALRLTRYRLDRVRLTDWATEWDHIEPHWTHRPTQ